MPLGDLREVPELTRVAAVESPLAGAADLLRALASPQARGQWGERMADDVLRLAGAREGVLAQDRLNQRAAIGRSLLGKAEGTLRQLLCGRPGCQTEQTFKATSFRTLS